MYYTQTVFVPPQEEGVPEWEGVEGSPDDVDPLQFLEGVASGQGLGVPPHPASSLHAQILQDFLAGVQTNFNSNSQSTTPVSPLPTDCYSWVPTTMREPNFLEGYKFSKRYSTRCPRGEAVGNYSILNPSEDEQVHGLGGVLTNALGTWSR